MSTTESIVQQLKILIPRLVLREFLLFPSEIATRQLFAELVVCNALKFAESADNRKFLTISYTEKVAARAPVGGDSFGILVCAGFKWDEVNKKLELPSQNFTTGTQPVLIAVRDALAAQKNSVFAQYRQHGQRLVDVVSLYIEMHDHRLRLQSNTLDSSSISSQTTALETMAAQHIGSIHNLISQSLHVTGDFEEMHVQVTFGCADLCNLTSPVWLDPHWVNNNGVICKSTATQKPDEQSSAISAYLRKELLEIQFLHKPAFTVAQLGVSRLLPIRTSPDGNCLLHALSVGLWGVEDKNQILRLALQCFISPRNFELSSKIRALWEAEEVPGFQKLITQVTAEAKSTSTLEEDVKLMTDSEWKSEVESARSSGSFLGSIHILALAHVLRRPIIVYGENNQSLGASLMRSENNIRGIYLPLLYEPSVCCSDPLPIYFDASHFCALTVIDDSLPSPALLPLHFTIADVKLQIAANGEINISQNDRLPLRYNTAMQSVFSVEQQLGRYLDLQHALGGSTTQDIKYFVCARVKPRKTYHELRNIQSDAAGRLPLNTQIDIEQAKLWLKYAQTAAHELEKKTAMST